MLFYLFLFFLFTFVAFCYTHSKNKYSSICFKIICFLILYIPAALRYGIGTDYNNYYLIYQDIQSGKIIIQEPGWYLLNFFIIKLGLGFQWVVSLSSFLTIYFVFKTQKKDFFVVTVLFFCLYYLDSYNIMRQTLAMSICWYSYLCYLKSKKLKCFQYIIFASLFHFSALIFLVITILFDCFKILSRKIFIYFFIFIVVFISSSIFEQILFDLLSFTRYSVYIEKLVYYNQRAGGFGNIWSITIRFGILLFMFLSIDMKYCFNKEYSSLQVLTISLLFFDVLGISIFMFQRIRMFFFLAYMALMKKANQRKSFYSKMQNTFFILFIILYYLIIKLFTGANAIIPYNHI